MSGALVCDGDGVVPPEESVDPVTVGFDPEEPVVPEPPPLTLGAAVAGVTVEAC
jgi:hypothetical protein